MKDVGFKSFMQILTQYFRVAITDFQENRNTVIKFIN